MTRRSKLLALLLWTVIVAMFTVAMSCDVPREPLYQPTRVRPTPRVIPPRGFHTIVTASGWIFIEPND